MENEQTEKKPLITIIIPSYNEGEVIASVVDKLAGLYPDYLILVVDDGSSDNTLKSLEGKPCRLVSHQYNRGYGASWKTGIKEADTDIVVFYDGDGQFHPEDVGRIVEELSDSGADLVIGQRTKDSHSPLMRRPGKKVLSLLANFLVRKKIPDLNCGLRGVKKRIIKRYVHLFPDGFSASSTSTIVFLKRGYKVNYVPITVKKRIGVSTVKPFTDGFSTILWMIRLIALFDPLRIFLSTSIFLFILSIFYSGYEVITTGLGVPVLGAVLMLSSVLFFALGIIGEQVSMIRLERFENDDVQSK